MPEKGIPTRVLRDAKGLAILTVVKVGFGVSGKGGQGVVVARTGRGWSGPSFVGTGGAGWGFQVGAQLTDFVFVLNSNAAVRSFSRDGNVTLGVDASVAAGPVGRDSHAGVTPTAAIYAYSRSKFVDCQLRNGRDGALRRPRCRGAVAGTATFPLAG